MFCVFYSPKFICWSSDCQSLRTRLDLEIQSLQRWLNLAKLIRVGPNSTRLAWLEKKKLGSRRTLRENATMWTWGWPGRGAWSRSSTQTSAGLSLLTMCLQHCCMHQSMHEPSLTHHSQKSSGRSTLLFWYQPYSFPKSSATCSGTLHPGGHNHSTFGLTESPAVIFSVALLRSKQWAPLRLNYSNSKARAII